jgi:flagellar basal body-associated protein FliL
MAKKNKTDAVEGEEPEKKSKKKLIVIGVLAAVGLFGAKTFLMKGQTPAQVAAAKVAAQQALNDLCDRQNDITPPKAPAKTTGTTTPTATTAPIDPDTERGPVLETDPLTVNLSDGHYLKVGVALQLTKKGVVETAKSNGLGAKALDMAIASLSPKTMPQLSQQGVREALKQKLGYDTCMAYNGDVLTVYFTTFVMQ